MPIIRGKKKENKEVEPKFKSERDPVSDEAMERLAQLMNDSPTLMKLHGTEWEIRSLKVGTQWMIAEEACKIIKQEKMSAGDVIKEMSKNVPVACRILTLALLNDKERIETDYQRVYDTLMWGDYDFGEWLALFSEILNLLDINFFFGSIAVIETIRTNALNRKAMTSELKQSSPVLNGAK